MVRSVKRYIVTVVKNGRCISREFSRIEDGYRFYDEYKAGYPVNTEIVFIDTYEEKKIAHYKA